MSYLGFDIAMFMYKFALTSGLVSILGELSCYDSKLLFR